MASTCLITGATGFVGSHLAEQARERGFTVRALVRPGRDTSFLQCLGVDLIPGDLSDPEALSRAVAGVEVILHAAAKVGDWGPVEDYRTVNVQGTKNLLEACLAQPVQRFIHLSSLGVYAARHHYGTDESEPLPEHHMDGYTQTKVESEQLVLRYQQEQGVPVVVLRPGFIYGPRDRTVLPALIENLRERRVRYLGSGQQAMNSIFVGNLVEAIFQAIAAPGAVGQVYNLTDGETISKRRFIQTICDGLGLPRPRPMPVPLWIAQALAWWQEGRARRRRAPEPPTLTQARIKFLGLNLDFSIAKAKRELGYQPRWGFEEAMQQTLRWYKGAESPSALSA
jgi:nucleoside-diphosphate-sugar epimerase